MGYGELRDEKTAFQIIACNLEKQRIVPGADPCDCWSQDFLVTYLTGDDRCPFRVIGDDDHIDVIGGNSGDNGTDTRQIRRV